MNSAKIVTKASASGFNRPFIQFLKIAFALATLWLVFYLFDIRSIKWQAIGAQTFVICAVLWLAHIGLQIWRWLFLLRLHTPSLSIWPAFASLFASFSLGIFTPGRLGELGRAFFIRELPWQAVSFLAVVERTFTVLALLVAGLTGLVILVQSHPQILGFLQLDLAPIMIVCIGAFAVLLFAWPRLKIWLKKQPGFLQLGQSIKQPKSLLFIYLASQLFVVIFCLQFALLLRAISGISLTSTFGAATAIQAVKSLMPFTAGDLGVREGVAAWLMQSLGATPESGVTAALILFGMNVLIPALIGVPFILINKTKTTEPRR